MCGKKLQFTCCWPWVLPPYFVLELACYRQVLYRWLPYNIEYQPYTPSHILTQLQLLMFAALAFVVLLQTRTYPAEQKATNLDTDWFYRRAYPEVIRSLSITASNMGKQLFDAAASIGGCWFSSRQSLTRSTRYAGPHLDDRHHGPFCCSPAMLLSRDVLFALRCGVTRLPRKEGGKRRLLEVSNLHESHLFVARV